METLKGVIRPIISKYESIPIYVKDQIQYLKQIDRDFSVLAACKKFRRISPALISLIVKEKRKVTLDRLDELAKLLQMTVPEKIFLRDWIERTDPKFIENIKNTKNEEAFPYKSRRKDVSLNILNDWLNVYVKDCFQLKAIQENPKLIYAQLAHIAEPKRIDKSIQFLLREGYLRKTLNNTIVIDAALAVAETPLPSHKIRQFHKAALNIARNGIDTVSMDKRYVNTLVMPLTKEKYADFVEIIQEFSEKIMKFSADLNTEEAESLYQFNLNLIPTGRKEV
jgi:uncharacterized protein (TIGR02147 family)